MNSNPNRSILIVDDDEAGIVKPLCEWFRQESWQAAGALNGRDCLESLRRQTPDVVLMDIRMPGDDGLTVLKRVAADFPTVCVVMFTAFDTRENFREAFRSGAWDFLCKPMDPLELVSQVEVQFDRFIGHRNAIAEKLRLYETLFNFCRALSHGLKNQMVPIRRWVKKLVGEATPEVRQKILNDRLEPLFDDTRQSLTRFEHYARLEEATPVEVCLLDLCRETAGKAVNRFIRYHVSTEPTISCDGDDSVHIMADPVLLGEIADNLFSNALESPAAGIHVTVTVRKDGGLAVLRIEDSGTGFDAEVLPHVGESVVTTKKAQGGFGVGLLMAARIARQLGGGFSVGNNSDRPGAWVELTFPISTSLTP